MKTKREDRRTDLLLIDTLEEKLCISELVKILELELKFQAEPEKQYIDLLYAYKTAELELTKAVDLLKEMKSE